jgi:hypothetical protein
VNYQSFDGWRVNRSLGRVRPGECLAFPLHQVYLRDGRFQQTRSGPNWQGRIATLTTCKHQLRTRNRAWHGTWIAAFTPRVGCDDNYLLFLARVSHAFATYAALIDVMPRDIVAAKRSDWNALGDLHIPRAADLKAYSPREYAPPCEAHVRWELDKKTGGPKWHKDINYATRAGRRPVLLSFDPAQTYLFDRPTYRATRALGRSGFTTHDIHQVIERV